MSETGTSEHGPGAPGGDELRVFFHREKARESLERSQRSVSMIRMSMLFAAVVIVAVGVFLIDGVAGYLVIAFGVLDGLFGVLWLPRVLLAGPRANAEVAIAEDSSLLVLTTAGVRRTPGDGAPTEIPYSEASLRRLAPATTGGPARLAVRLPGEPLDLRADLLHPDLEEILEAYDRLNPARSTTGRPAPGISPQVRVAVARERTAPH
ncbi:hypothetical protein [Brachybacterium sp.]|uniref:hypothetical protein n=1 Tax=Brachybacterium sp. TaxID=1891286 RepID=UPI003F93BC06